MHLFQSFQAILVDGGPVGWIPCDGVSAVLADGGATHAHVRNDEGLQALHLGLYRFHIGIPQTLFFLKLQITGNPRFLGL